MEEEEEVLTKKEAHVEVPATVEKREEEGPTEEAPVEEEKTTEKVFGPSTKQKEAEQKEPKEVPASIPTSSSSSDGQNPAPPKRPTLVKREDVKTEGSAPW